MGTDYTQQQFLQFIQQNRGIIHKVCHLYGYSDQDKQDLFQEIIIQLWKAFPKFRNESKISTWMYRIALNTAISDFRKQQRRVETIGVEINENIFSTDREDEEKKERLLLMQKAISYLSELEKALVVLYLEDKSYEEMEEIMGMSQVNLRVKISRIKEKLRKNIEQL